MARSDWIAFLQVPVYTAAADMLPSTRTNCNGRWENQCHIAVVQNIISPIRFESRNFQTNILTMKILFSDNTLWGLLNFRGHVIRHFIQCGHEVVIVAPQDKTSDMKATVPADIRFIPIKMERSKTSPTADLRYFFDILKIYRKEKADYIFHYTIKPNIYGSIAARILSIRSTLMMTGLGYTFSNDKLISRIARGLYKLGVSCSERVLLLNQDNYNEVVRRNFCTPQKITLLEGGEGVDAEAFPYQDNTSSETTFLYIGRILYDKGYREFVNCAKEIRRDFPQVKFEILGTFDKSYPKCVDEKEFEEDCKSGAIEYLGFTSDVRKILARKGIVVVIPSYYGEGLNRSLMEACASGKPIITTNIGGCRETVVDKENGFLIPPKSSNELVKAVRRYLSLTVKEKQGMSLQSRKLAEQRFDIRKVIDVYEQIIYVSGVSQTHL